jgi:hypothetical protein
VYAGFNTSFDRSLRLLQVRYLNCRAARTPPGFQLPWLLTPHFHLLMIHRPNLSSKTSRHLLDKVWRFDCGMSIFIKKLLSRWLDPGHSPFKIPIAKMMPRH